jgi:hypothetical protein
MAVVRSSGTTPSERYLAKRCERSFLSLWTYPNVYRDQGRCGKGDGKEVCDQLVVCGDDIILFSDKQIEFPGPANSPVAWDRWFKRAVVASARQLKGAARWLNDPDRLFLDSRCLTPLPIALPHAGVRRVHRVAVALGAGQACRTYFGGGSGSLRIVPDIEGTAHIGAGSPALRPFAVGDIDRSQGFVHVFDDVTLDLILAELDTVTDFVRYLTRREEFIRSGHLLSSAGDEELLGYYLSKTNSEGEHCFKSPSGADAWEPNEVLTLVEGIWEHTQRRPEFVEKKRADEVSYLWDKLIESFAGHLLAGTAVTSEADPGGRRYEQILRHMARESRLDRRSLAVQILDAMGSAASDRALARVIGLRGSPFNRTIYIFLQFPFNLAGGAPDYAEYRRRRSTMLYAYAMALKSDYREIPRVIGIGVEPPRFNPATSISQDLLMVEIDEWTDLHQQEADDLRNTLGIMNPRTLRQGRFRTQEYPDPIGDE